MKEASASLTNDTAKQNIEEWLERVSKQQQSNNNNNNNNTNNNNNNTPSELGSYEFNKKFLMKVTVLGNTQLAFLIGARGPNVLINAACSSTTMAVGIAEDWIRLGMYRKI